MDTRPKLKVPKKKKKQKPASAVVRQPGVGQHKDFLGIAETTEILAEMYQNSFGGMAAEADLYPPFAIDGFAVDEIQPVEVPVGPAGRKAAGAASRTTLGLPGLPSSRTMGDARYSLLNSMG